MITPLGHYWTDWNQSIGPWHWHWPSISPTNKQINLRAPGGGDEDSHLSSSQRVLKGQADNCHFVLTTGDQCNRIDFKCERVRNDLQLSLAGNCCWSVVQLPPEGFNQDLNHFRNLSTRVDLQIVLLAINISQPLFNEVQEWPLNYPHHHFAQRLAQRQQSRHDPNEMAFD